MYVEINRCSIVKYCYVVTKVYGDYAINSERTFSGTNIFVCTLKSIDAV